MNLIEYVVCYVMKYRGGQWRSTTSLLKANNKHRYTYRALSILLGVFVLCCLTSQFNQGGNDGLGGNSGLASIVAGTINDDDDDVPSIYGMLIYVVCVSDCTYSVYMLFQIHFV